MESSLASQNVVSLARRGGGGGWFGGGFMAVPGTYTAHLAKVEAGVVTTLDDPIEFE
jgi:mannitol/fructose-specific phosphotransferase system IIA component (Ntr-type)